MFREQLFQREDNSADGLRQEHAGCIQGRVGSRKLRIHVFRMKGSSQREEMNRKANEQVKPSIGGWKWLWKGKRVGKQLKKNNVKI